MEASERGRALGLIAILFVCLAISNLLKPLELNAQHGFVFLGRRLTGAPNLVAGPIFGIYLLAYAAGIWRLRRYALPMGVLYAAYVILNLVLFPLRTPGQAGSAGFIVAYAAVAIGVSSGSVLLLSRRRAALR